MDIHNQLSKLIQKTLEDKVDWKSINPNAFRWVVIRGSNQFVTTFQGLNIPPQNVNLNFPSPIGNGTFVFTLQSINPSETLIQLQVTQHSNPEYLDELTKLYFIILEKTKKDYSKILDDLLDNM